MSKILDLYTKDKDGNDISRTWFQSSNIKYSECVDYDSKLKTLRVVFNNGNQYEYKNVDVKDFLFFRDASSQGKALNEYIKKKGYEYEKIQDANIDELDEELNFRMRDGIYVFYDDGKFIMKNYKDNIICEKNVSLTETAFNTICSALEAVGKQLYTEGKNFVEDGENGEIKPF